MSASGIYNAITQRGYILSPAWNALFSSIVVMFCFNFGTWMGLVLPAIIISAQSVTGVNVDENYVNKLKLASLAGLVLITATSLSVVAKAHVALAFATVIVMSIGFGYIRQIFPRNWPEIIIPAGVLFFVSYESQLTYEPIIAALTGAGIGLLSKSSLGALILLRKKYVSHDHSPPGHVAVNKLTFQERFAPGLSRENFLYALELGLLMILTTVFMLYSDSRHAYWVPITVLIVLRLGPTGTLRRIIQRMIGTILGSLLGTSLLYIEPTGYLLSLIMGLNVFLWLLYMGRNFFLSSLFVTSFVIILLGRNTEDLSQLFMERILFTAIGVILVLLSYHALLRFRREG